jgi:hypothetical protein
MSINIGPAEAKICDGGISFVKHPITTNSSISSASLPDFLQLYAHIFHVSNNNNVMLCLKKTSPSTPHKIPIAGDYLFEK